MRLISRFKKSPLIAGTLILTATSFLTRIIGFFYRIFLSQIFGEEGMGIFQLTAPVMALAFSFSAAGLQTSVSRYVAGEPSTRDYPFSFRILITGGTLACLLSFLCTGITYYYSDDIASILLKESRCAPILRISALSFPFSAIHSIAKGYFYGIKNTKLPAATQLIEQLIRVSSVYLIYLHLAAQGKEPTIAIAVVGVVLEEFVSFLISIAALSIRFQKLWLLCPACASSGSIHFPLKRGYLSVTAGLMRMAFPLTLNRIVINLLQSVEAVYIPTALRTYGLNQSAALSTYGVLTGMALPLILFPSALISSVCVLLLPTVAEAQTRSDYTAIRRTVSRAIRYSTYFGIFCTTGFLLFGRLAGKLLFHSSMAGGFILTLSFICPFMYITSTLASILNGLGKTGVTFCLNVSGLLIRLLFVFFLVPHFGIRGYLWGLLVSELILTFADIAVVRYFTQSYCTEKSVIL
ncbi:MAG: polysaccharide biosynthesis protein [Clostridiales bacterium]|nr:polysaccharide biosynthesis protein [Clostridiales bacterium]